MMNIEETAVVIHNEAKFALENIGIQFFEEKDRGIIDAILEKVPTFGGKPGAMNFSGRLYFTSELIDWAMDVVPKRDAFPISEGSMVGGGTANWVYDHDKNIWVQPNHGHVAQVAKFAEKKKIPATFRGVGPAPNRWEDTEQIKIMREHYKGFCYFYVATEAGVQACREEYARNPNMATTHDILFSPLKINNTGPNWPIFLKCVEAGLPIYLVTMPQMMVTAPANAYGTVLTAHIEFLAGLAITQVLNPGLMTIHAGFPLGTNALNSYNKALGSIVHNQMNIRLAQIAAFYDLTAIQDGCSVSGLVDEYGTLDPKSHPDALRGYKMWNAAGKEKIKGRRTWHQCRHFIGFRNLQILYSHECAEQDYAAYEYVRENDLVEEVPALEYDPAILNINGNPTKGIMWRGIHSRNGNFMEMDHTLRNQQIVT